MQEGLIPDLEELTEEFGCRPVANVVNLAGYDPGLTPFVAGKSDAKDQLDGELADELFDLHELLFANEERAVLLVLQGVDCSGKNGTIKHVAIKMNPAAVHTACFSEPTEEELEHHFLWRYREQLPGPGQLGVFARSHYEDVLVPAATGTLDEDVIAGRLDEINAFEQELVEAGTVIVKCMLHISFDEQRRRFLRRLRRDDKRWKFAMSDLDNRTLWNEFLAAYGRVMAATSTDDTPWLVIPSDNKWYRNWAIAAVLVGTFESMKMAYPQPELPVEEIRRRLEAPN